MPSSTDSGASMRCASEPASSARKSGVPELTSRMPMRSGFAWGMAQPIPPPSADADTQVLELGVVEDPVLRALAAGARLLDPPEGGNLGGDDPGVQAHDAVLQRLRHAP